MADQFVEQVVAETQAGHYGDPSDREVSMGTVINEQAALFFESRVNEAAAQGAKLLVGNQRQGAIYSPTVVVQVPHEMLLVKEETLGPVLRIIRFKDIDEAIQIANGTADGLSSGACTNRLEYITRFVSEPEVGSVNVREVPGYWLELTRHSAASRTPAWAIKTVYWKPSSAAPT